jgi:hypothetical protein
MAGPDHHRAGLDRAPRTLAFRNIVGASPREAARGASSALAGVVVRVSGPYAGVVREVEFAKIQSFTGPNDDDSKIDDIQALAVQSVQECQRTMMRPSREAEKPEKFRENRRFRRIFLFHYVKDLV